MINYSILYINSRGKNIVDNGTKYDELQQSKYL